MYPSWANVRETKQHSVHVMAISASSVASQNSVRPGEWSGPLSRQTKRHCSAQWGPGVSGMLQCLYYLIRSGIRQPLRTPVVSSSWCMLARLATRHALDSCCRSRGVNSISTGPGWLLIALASWRNRFYLRDNAFKCALVRQTALLPHAASRPFCAVVFIHNGAVISGFCHRGDNMYCCNHMWHASWCKR